MDEKLKITFEIGDEKIIVETDVHSVSTIDSSIEKAKSIAKLMVKDSKLVARTSLKPGPKPGKRKTILADTTKERKKPGPKPGKKSRAPRKAIPKVIAAKSTAATE